MKLKELQLLSEALWESVKSDLKFFAPIQVFIKRLSEVDYSDPTSLSDIKLYSDKIEEFFKQYRSTSSSGFYFPPAQASTNDTTVKSIYNIVQQLDTLSEEELVTEFESIKPKTQTKSVGLRKIFLGHGRSKLWARLQIFIKDDLNLETLTFEDESRTSESIVNILGEFLDNSSLAILVMTAEDETSEGKTRARQNVIHEAGLFQGRLGFDKVIILKQEGVEEFTNIAGLQYIPFSGENIEQCFYELQRKFKKLGLIK
ncbi:TIR domain-containing protein [Sphingobacterium chuzhouense]|uniref:Nucleotide-binding protein n=1 Tax=Sphingobacterium chuzhouense TaxID=1742264 RepID=A0ABR7XU52_9SPHI|nr:nucleotide-binding protein [Sphingobacterium chuzhouense]MBD1422584.1 nucleotide-binding protein [Sphingobacterium chuzhouense]